MLEASVGNSRLDTVVEEGRLLAFEGKLGIVGDRDIVVGLEASLGAVTFSASERQEIGLWLLGSHSY